MRVELRGLADYAREVVPGVFAPYSLDGFGQHVVWPDRLDLATRDNGDRELALTLYRGEDPSRPPKPYAQLDARVICHYPMEDALRTLRAHVPNGRATLRVAQPAGGFVRLTSLPGGELPDELLEPIAIVGDGLDHIWIRRRMSIDAGIVIRDALARGVLLARTDLQLDLPGVSPRVEAEAKFDPHALLEELRARADSTGLLGRDQVCAHVLANLDALVPTRSSAQSDPKQIAEALVDRILARFASPVMAMPGQVTVRLAAPETEPGGRFSWNLAEPHLTSRVVMLELDTFDAARRATAAAGIEAVVHMVTVPSLATGELAVTVDLNVPERPEGLLGVGVTLEAPPSPPHRLQSAIATIDLSEQRVGTARLRLAAGEPQEYFYTVFAIVRGEGAIDRLIGPRTAHHGEALYLAPGEVPVEFVPVAADEGLLAQADVEVLLRWSVGDHRFEHRATITADAKVLSLVLPRQHEDATLDVTLVERGGSARRNLPTLPGTGVRLGLHSVPEYGPHEMRVEARFDHDARPQVVEIVPEDEPAGTPQTLLFSPNEPAKTFSYHASSVFRSGVRWRRRTSSDQSGFSAWTTAPALEPLVIRVDEEVNVELEEVICERDPSSKLRFFWSPRRPRPELGPNGKPTLMLIAGTERGVLQLGLRWYASDPEIEQLRAKLETTVEGSFELVPATVEKVDATLMLDGVELAHSSTSGVAPYSALFNVRLERAQLESTRKALSGRRGLLLARYRAVTTRSTRVTVAIAGDVAVDVAKLMGEARREAADTHVEAALAEGRLRVVGDKRPELLAQAKQACAQLLWNIASGADLTANPANLRAEVSTDERHETPLEATADIGAWFTSEAGIANVVELPPGTNP